MADDHQVKTEIYFHLMMCNIDIIHVDKYILPLLYNGKRMINYQLETLFDYTTVQ